MTNVMVQASVIQRIINNFSGILASEAIGKGFIFISNIILARRLGVEGFGLFTLAQTIAYFLWVGADLGTYMYGIREVARNRDDDKVLGTLISLKIVSGICFYSIYALTIFLLPTNLSMQERLIFIASGLYILTYPFFLIGYLKELKSSGF
jgi:O-antigen/teichoic acid export membrane protein